MWKYINSNENILPKESVERVQNDTCLWKK